MKASLSIVTAALVAGAAIATPLAGQQQLPVFRSEANYVEVTARVVDRDGRFVDGLTAKDFSLTEDHRAQTVEHAFRVDLSTPWNKTTAAKPVMYRPGLPNDVQVVDGRIYLLYLNSVPTNRVVETRTAAHEFVNKYLQPEDIMAVWSTFGGVTFTNDKAMLNKKIEEFIGSTDLYAPVPKTGDPGGLAVGLSSALDWFSGVQGRKKSVLLFSAGWDGIAPVFSNFQAPAPFTTHLLDRSDVQIYALDTRGLTSPPGLAGPVAANAAAAAGAVTSSAESFFISSNNMRWLAEDSGGFAIQNINQYDQGFRRIVEENSTYYVLGYQSTTGVGPNWDYRELSVKLADPKLKGARVQVRKGYIARR
jgi:VWFA-related protein